MFLSNWMNWFTQAYNNNCMPILCNWFVFTTTVLILLSLVKSCLALFIHYINILISYSFVCSPVSQLIYSPLNYFDVDRII